jgi:ABC-type phosphate/phosphonate transport system substrate-binding protein
MKAATTAAAIAAVAVLAGCGGGSGGSKGLSDKVRSDFVAGCTSSGQTQAGCECIFDDLKNKQGVDTEAKLKAMGDKVKAATQSGNIAGIPTEFRQAVLDCRSKIVKPPGG